MAAESEILRLLFSMTGIRSIYSTFLQGRNAAQSELQLRTGLEGMFPASDPLDIAYVAETVWAAKLSGHWLNNYYHGLQNQAGIQWPGVVQAGQIPEATAPINVTNAPVLQTLSVPGAPAAKYVVNAVTRVTTQTASGAINDRTIQFTTVWERLPTYAELLDAIVSQVDATVGEDRYRETLVIDVGTGQPNISVDITTVIIVSP